MAIWNILQTLGTFYDHLVHFVFTWYIFPVWVIFTKKNLATLVFLLHFFPPATQKSFLDGWQHLGRNNERSKIIISSSHTSSLSLCFLPFIITWLV
jgi:hypothetical protein